MRGPRQRMNNSKNASPKSQAAGVKGERKISKNFGLSRSSSGGRLIEHAQRCQVTMGR